MPEIQSKYFGKLNYSEDARLYFPDGLPGFEGEHWFVLIELEGLRPLAFLQSQASPGLCFLALPVQTLEPTYRLQLSPEDREALGFPAGAQPAIGADILCLALLAVPHEGAPSANLRSPIVVNLRTLEAAQVIQPESDYPLRADLPQAAREVLC